MSTKESKMKQQIIPREHKNTEMKIIFHKWVIIAGSNLGRFAVGPL